MWRKARLCATCGATTLIFLIAALHVTLYANVTEENAEKTGVVKGDSYDGTTDGDGRSLKVGAFRDPWLKNFDGQSSNESEGTASPHQFVSNSSIFNVTINTFSKDFVTPYTAASELEEDLTAVMLLYADAVISRAPSSAPGLSPIPPAAALPEDPAEDEVSDFETNNQEEGVDEADGVKSDGRYVYASYGDNIVVWEALTGVVVTNVTILPVGERTYREPIQDLLLSGSRLTAIVYGSFNRGEMPHFRYGHISTLVIIYCTESLSSTGELVKVHERELFGVYRDARSIGDVVHLVTTAELDFYATIARPLIRRNPQFDDLDDEAYIHQAKFLAVRELVPTFVSAVISAISHEDGTLPNVARVGLWQESLSNHTGVERFVYARRSLVETYMQVASFNVSVDGDDLDVSLSGAFMPSSPGFSTYATTEMLIFAAKGWNWIESLNGGGQATYLMGFSINGTSTTPSAVGFMPGFLLNQYSLDIFDGHLRAATTIRSFWTVGDDRRPLWQWTTLNQVIVLRIPGLTDDGEAGLFEETGRIPDLGKELEVFTAVRFFDKIAYAVTFRRTDPFYVLNLTDPNDPMLLGELSITGFSSYLHSVNRDETILVAVGQEADENGRIVGLQVTLFDATDPTNPGVIDRYLVENSRYASSSSSVRWDYKAFRWVGFADALGMVILPVNVRSGLDRSQNFDGFLVLNVVPRAVSQRFNVTHAEGEEFFGCYYWGRLPERSMLFDGIVTTLKGHSVIATDMFSGDVAWKLDMRKPTDPRECRYW